MLNRTALAACLAALFCAGWAAGAEYYVSPQGAAGNAGTKEAPWDIASALTGAQKTGAGDTIWLMEGAYLLKTPKFEVSDLSGSAEKPLRVRALPGKRVTLDGNLSIARRVSHVWFEGFEITLAESTAKSNYNGALEIMYTQDCKFINLNIHDIRAVGVGCWMSSVDTELYGLLVYPGKNSDHCLYTQNDKGVKTISNCIMQTSLGDPTWPWSLHGHGTKNAAMSNYVIEDNVFIGQCKLASGQPAVNNRMARNHIYIPQGQLSLFANDIEFRDNIIKGPVALTPKDPAKVSGNTTYVGWPSTKFGAPPKGAKTVLLPNKYDPGRAHLVVWNWDRAPSVSAKTAPFLKPGDKYRLLRPDDLYGKPILEGTCDADEIRVPMPRLPHFDGEFGAFVLFKTGVE